MKVRLLAAIILLGIISSVFAARVPLADIQARKDGKHAVSLFQPWRSISGGIIDTAGLHEYQKIAIHDLVFHNPGFYGLKWAVVDTNYPGLGETFVESSIAKGLAFRDSLLHLNPNIILIGEVRYYDAPPGFLPPDSPWWLGEGSGYEDYQKLDWANPGFQQHVANQCVAFLESGVVDGVLLDWAKNERKAMFEKVRAEIGPDAVLIGNTNARYDLIDEILPLCSGNFMESGWWPVGDDVGKFLDYIYRTVEIAQSSLKEPKLILTEAWSDENKPDLDSTLDPETGRMLLSIAPEQESLMRAACAAHYVQSNGYYSFYPQTFRSFYLAEHMHVYHDFFNAYLGAFIPGAPEQFSGSAIKREWENGTVVFNPPNNGTVTIDFAESRRSQATGTVATSHTVPAGDGDIFLKGAYTQIYPDVKDYPDTTYKNSFPVATAPKIGISHQPVNRPVTIKPIIRNQKILFQKQEEGKAPQYFNTKGRQMKALEKVKK